MRPKFQIPKAALLITIAVSQRENNQWVKDARVCDDEHFSPDFCYLCSENPQILLS